MATRAVHLEVACSLEANSFLQALFHFIHRRGSVSDIFSDNGTNFVMAERELRAGIKRWNQQLIHKSLSQKGVKWHFNPPHSPSRGGAWEILVKAVKKILRSLMKDTFTNESLYTLLVEVEWIINTRLLTPVSNSPNDFSALTMIRCLPMCFSKQTKTAVLGERYNF